MIFLLPKVKMRIYVVFILPVNGRGMVGRPVLGRKKFPRDFSKAKILWNSIRP